MGLTDLHSTSDFLTGISPSRQRARWASSSPDSRRGFAIGLVSCIAALAYCSWPIGFLVNPVVVTTQLASYLEARSQPFSWLFVLLDCVAGIATLVAVRLAWPSSPSTSERLARVALVGYALFGVATAANALVPVSCGSASPNVCGVDLAHPNVDDWMTGIAFLALFVAAVCAQTWAARTWRWNPVSIGSLIATVVWSATGLVFLAFCFSIRPAVLLQHLVLTLTSTLAFTIPTVLVVTRRHVEREPSETSQHRDERLNRFGIGEGS